MLMFNIKEWNYIITKTSDLNTAHVNVQWGFWVVDKPLNKYLNTSHVNVQYLCDSLKGLTSINLNTSHVNVQWK